MTADQRGTSGAVLKCADARVLVMGFIDGELSAEALIYIRDVFNDVLP